MLKITQCLEAGLGTTKGSRLDQTLHFCPQKSFFTFPVQHLLVYGHSIKCDLNIPVALGKQFVHTNSTNCL